MKKLMFFIMSLATISAAAQTKGNFETYDLGTFTLHVYYTADPMGDASFIIEGQNALVTLEQPLFKDNVAEYDAYLAKIGKPVEARIADYHLGGTGTEPVVMAEGMPEFVKGEIYGGMMAGFAQGFGDAIVDLPTGATTEAAFGSSESLAGVSFEFSHGAATDFPGASILIGGKVYFTHWVPAKAHVSNLQVSSAAAIDAELAEAEKSLNSGAELFIGGHGGAAGVDAVQFKISYLTDMKRIYGENQTAEGFVQAMKEAYPGLAGEEGLTDLAAALYASK